MTHADDPGQKALNRRMFLRWAALSGGAVVLAACGGASPAPSADAPTAASNASSAAPTTASAAAATSAPEPPAVPTVISVANARVTLQWANPYTSATTQELLPKMIAEFNKEYPDIGIEYQNPGNGTNYNDLLQAQIAAGTPPDVATLFSTPIEYGARGALLALDDYMKTAKYAKPDAIFAGPLASCQWQSKTYGLPSSAGAGAMYVNLDLLKAKNITFSRDTFPKTWSDLKALSQSLVVKENGELKQAGIVPFVGQEWMYPVWSALNGGTLYDAAANKYVLDSDNNVQWLDFWLSILDEQYDGDFDKLNAVARWDDAYPDFGFHNAKSALVGTGSWVTTDADIPFAFDVARFPVGPSGKQSVTPFYPNWWTVMAGSKHPEEAFQFIEFIATKGWQTWYSFIMDTPAWKNFPPEITTTKLEQKVGKARAVDFNKFFADYLNTSAPMWNSPIEGFAQQTLTSSIGEVLAKKKKPKEALAEAQQICQSKLEETLKS